MTLTLTVGQILSGNQSYEIVQLAERPRSMAAGVAKAQASGQLVTVRLLGEGSRQRFTPRFERTVALLSKVESRHVVRIRDFGVAGDTPFIILDHCEGQPLREVLAEAPDGRLRQDLAFSYLAQITQTLVQTSRHGLVHGDIKPQNILITPDGVVKVLGFGMISILGFADFVSNDLTETLPYIAPELLEIRTPTADIRADIYSAGAIAYEMLCGHAPFNGRTLRDFVHMVVMDVRVPASHYNPGLSSDVDAFLKRCLATNPAGRFETPENMLVAMRALGCVDIEGSRAVLISANGQAYAIPETGGILGRADPQHRTSVAVDLSQERYGRTVSRRQAKLGSDDGQWNISPYANTTNATILNGHALEAGKQYLLKNGDQLQIGGVRLTLELHDALSELATDRESKGD